MSRTSRDEDIERRRARARQKAAEAKEQQGTISDSEKATLKQLKKDKKAKEKEISKKENYVSWSQLISNGLIELTKHDERVSVITPAMINGSALNEYQKQFPTRLIDVGIAEEHAVTMAGGMATQGMKPFVSIYSTFFKRAFDQVHHDVARQNLNVVFGVDRAGIVGADGETHQGLLDLAFLNTVPNMTIMACKDFIELEKMLDFAIDEMNSPVAIRYPRGSESKVVFGNCKDEFSTGICGCS